MNGDQVARVAQVARVVRMIWPELGDRATEIAILIMNRVDLAETDIRNKYPMSDSPSLSA